MFLKNVQYVHYIMSGQLFKHYNYSTLFNIIGLPLKQ